MQTCLPAAAQLKEGCWVRHVEPPDNDVRGIIAAEFFDVYRRVLQVLRQVAAINEAYSRRSIVEKVRASGECALAIYKECRARYGELRLTLPLMETKEREDGWFDLSVSSHEHVFPICFCATPIRGATDSWDPYT